MGRPVDSDALKAIIQRICELCGEDKKYNGTMCRCCAIDGLVDEIEELPTVDGMEVTYVGKA